jgi:hypothetical protein
MKSKDIGNQSMPKDVSSSKDRSNGAKEHNTRFLYGLSKTESSSKTGAEEHSRKMMEARSFDEAMNISSSSVINHFGRKLSKSRSDISGMEKNKEKLERRYSSFDESKYSQTSQAFFDAKEAIKKSPTTREIDKKKENSDVGRKGKEDNKKEKSTEALINQKRMDAAFGKAMCFDIPYGIAAASNELEENWKLDIRIKSPKKSD